MKTITYPPSPNHGLPLPPYECFPKYYTKNEAGFVPVMRNNRILFSVIAPEKERNQQVQVIIKDNGNGMPADILFT